MKMYKKLIKRKNKTNVKIEGSKRKNEKRKRITLISLVVTIIVLIILAGISINLILGQDGIINRAKQAKENMEIATIEEQEQLNELYEQMGTQINSSSTGNSKDESKINDFKIAIADYIAEAGGIKPEYTADTVTFGESIKGIVKEATKDATATESDIASGKTAYVNGIKIIGTKVEENSTIEEWSVTLKPKATYASQSKDTYYLFSVPSNVEVKLDVSIYVPPNNGTSNYVEVYGKTNTSTGEGYGTSEGEIVSSSTGGTYTGTMTISGYNVIAVRAHVTHSGNVKHSQEAVYTVEINATW